MATNYTFIHVHPNKFELRPCPVVTVGFEPLIIVIDWSDNVGSITGHWTEVQVQNFTRDNAALDPVLQSQTHPTFKPDPTDPRLPKPDEPNTNTVSFLSTPLPDDHCYKYELRFRRSDGAEFIVDPTLIIRRIGP